MDATGMGWYLFGLGLATGLVVLDATVYRKLSPRWLRWTLLSLAACTAVYYIVMARAQADHAVLAWSWRWTLCVVVVGFILPSLLALDQLVRHPSWSAAKVVRCVGPLLAVYAAALLSGGPRMLLAGFQVLLSLGVCVLCGLLMAKLRSPRVRVALAGLFLAHLALGIDGALLAAGVQYVRPFVWSEMLALAAIGHAFDTALQRAA